MHQECRKGDNNGVIELWNGGMRDSTYPLFQYPIIPISPFLTLAERLQIHSIRLLKRYSFYSTTTTTRSEYDLS